MGIEPTRQLVTGTLVLKKGPYIDRELTGIWCPLTVRLGVVVILFANRAFGG